MYADPNRYKPIAIVVPAEATLNKFVATKGLAPADTSLESLVQDKKVVDEVYAELLAVGKRGGLTGIEMIQGLVLVPEEWTPENVPLHDNGELTVEFVNCSEEVEQEEYFVQVPTISGGSSLFGSANVSGCLHEDILRSLIRMSAIVHYFGLIDIKSLLPEIQQNECLYTPYDMKTPKSY